MHVSYLTSLLMSIVYRTCHQQMKMKNTVMNITSLYIYTLQYTILYHSPLIMEYVYNFKIPTKKYKIHKYSRIYIHRSSVLAFATVGVFVSQFS